MLTAGKPMVRDEAVILSKFHRGLDLTLADRFDYTAFDPIAARTGSDDPASWDVGGCPILVCRPASRPATNTPGFCSGAR